MQVFRVLIIASVLVGIAFALRSAWLELEKSEINWSEVRPIWLLLSGMAYAIGMLVPAIYWHQLLRLSGNDPGIGNTIRAFYLSQLGKYVPGKAMVVVIRTNEIGKSGVNPAFAATTVFIETLTWMSVGASLGAIVLAVALRDQVWLIAIAVAIAIVAGIPSLGPVMRKIVAKLKVNKLDHEIETRLRRLSLGFTACGYLFLIVGWLLMAASLYFVLQALPDPRPAWEHFPLVLAGVSLAVVCGFLSLIPGGLGVRELVMLPILGPIVGPVSAIVAVVLLRLVWLVAELACAAVLRLIKILTIKRTPVLS